MGELVEVGMTPIEKVARAMKSYNYRVVYDDDKWCYWVEQEGCFIEEFTSESAAHERCDELNARAAIEALRSFIHECSNYASHETDKAITPHHALVDDADRAAIRADIDAKINAALGEEEKRDG